MELKSHAHLVISEELLEAIRTLPAQREIEHCGTAFAVDPFEFYVECPRCHAKIKVRSFSGVGEVEDVFDAVFEWMKQPGAQEAAARRQKALEEDG